MGTAFNRRNLWSTDRGKYPSTSLVIFHGHYWIAWVCKIKFLSPIRINASGCARSDSYDMAGLILEPWEERNVLELSRLSGLHWREQVLFFAALCPLFLHLHVPICSLSHSHELRTSPSTNAKLGSDKEQTLPLRVLTQQIKELYFLLSNMFK